MRTVFGLAALAAGLFFATGTALAADPPKADPPKADPAKPADDAPKPSQGTYVVIVGVSETADPTIQPRPSADADAKALYDLFTDKKHLDVPADRITLLTSKADDKRKGGVATREAIVKAVHDAVSKTGKDDLLVIAFFGRGASAGDRTCLFAADTTFKERAKTGVLGSDVEADLKAARHQRVLVMMDVHFKGYDAGKETVVEPTFNEVITSLFGEEDKSRQSLPREVRERLLPPNKVFMLAAVPPSDPLEKGENGLFAATVIAGLKGAADIEGYEPDGLVTADELSRYVEKEMPDQARALGKTAKEKESLPLVLGEKTSHFTVDNNPAVREKVQKRIKAIEKLGEDGELKKEIAAEGVRLLTRMPRLAALQELRKNYQSLADGTMKADEFNTAYDAVKKGMVLPEEDAEMFVKKVMAAADFVEAAYVKPTVKGTTVAAAVSGMYRLLEVTMPADLEAKLKDAATWKKADMEAALTAGRLKLGKREDLDGHKDADLAITMLLGSLNDPYTMYIDKETVKKSDSALSGRFGGVGIQIRRDLVNDAILVASPIMNGPAYKGGLQAGDLIVGIKRTVDPDGKELKPTDPKEFSTKGMSIDQAQTIILGKPGVPVTLTIRRPDGKEEDVTLKRALVTSETVLGVKREENDSWNFWLDEKAKVGYVQLTQFTPDSVTDMADALRKLKKDGMQGLVLDLRFNPGGSLDAAGAICSMFIESGKVVTVKSRVRADDVLKTSYFKKDLPKDLADDPYLDLPMTVLVNGDSASASEIVSACLQDYGRAVVVGERSYGKGSVQTVGPFRPTEGKIKLTFARYFPPLDRNIDKLSTPGKPEDEWGVKPNDGYEVKLAREERTDLVELFRDREIIPRKDGKGPKPEEKKKEFKDTQLEKAVEHVKEQIKTAKK